MINEFEIGGKEVGRFRPTFISACLGSNHEMRLGNARVLIDIAQRSGVDAIDISLIRASDIIKDTKSPLYKSLKEYELSFKWIKKLSGYIKKCDMSVIASVSGESMVKVSESYVDAFRLPSVTEYDVDYLKAVHETKLPVLITTGVTDEDKIRRLLETFSNRKVAILQSTLAKPTPYKSVNLKVVPRMIKEYGTLVGVHDYTDNPYIVPLSSIAMGGSIVSKYITFNKKLPGPDHKFSIEEDALESMVDYIRKLELALGTSKKVVLDEELDYQNLLKDEYD